MKNRWGVKWICTFRCSARNSSTRLVLWLLTLSQITFGLVAADVVADHMNLAALGLAGHDVVQEGHELLAGVARGGLAQHFAGGGVQRSEQTQRAVALVFEAVALGTAR